MKLIFRIAMNLDLFGVDNKLASANKKHVLQKIFFLFDIGHKNIKFNVCKTI